MATRSARPLSTLDSRRNIGNAGLEKKELRGISGGSIYDRIGRGGTSSLANRNRDTPGAGVAAQSSKPQFIFIVYIRACRIRRGFYRRSIAASMFDKFSSGNPLDVTAVSDRYSPRDRAISIIKSGRYLRLVEQVAL